MPVIRSIHANLNVLLAHKDSRSIDIALDTIDLAKIYENVDKLEQENKDPNLGYDDLVVKELLRYFKHDFFKWINSPDCPCGSDKVISKGASRFPSNTSNPHKISIVEVYQCEKCKQRVEFPRVNNPLSLLAFRKGRCGEWVNAFLLLLEALIGEGKDRTRYVMNHEDHVWCEYFSYNLKRWVHLDPCEAVFDEPLLYCNNWGKQMSYVIGFNANSVVDLSGKYITKEKQIPQSSIVDPNLVAKTIRWINGQKLQQLYNSYRMMQNKTEDQSLIQLYNDAIVPRNHELLNETETFKPTTSHSEIPQGRQTGSSEWTKARGESG
ncbi:PNG1 [Candida oxycetoniae]|uniref:Peptide:N-glycanase 1 n=1 Tax=Candida oxycetoniae TaxID=497107 RepID=A0AAI9SYF3_9ASCO|nr:PNG1 [Candida oxycetoniae]KAI3405276.2 PNG1 [Candida oxycetoniae]